MTAPLAATRPSLTQRALRGVAWTLPMSLASRAVGLVGTLLLARYLAPAEYGEVSAAAIVALTGSNVTAFGIGVYVVAKRDLSRAEAFHASCWFLGTGAAAIGAIAALSGPLGAWFDVPTLARFLPLFLVSMALDRLAYMPERVLVRNLRFRWLSLTRAFGELAYTGVSLGLAASGAGALAIAWGNLARSALRFAALVPAVAWREWLEPHRLRWTTMRTIVAYGVNVAMTSIAEFAMRRWDNLIVSRYFGPGVMGAYNYAYNLAEVPATAVGEQLTDVAFASFPHVERERRAAAVVRSFRMVSLVMLPLAAGLGAVAPSVVEAFFDQKWATVGTMLVFLAVLSATKPMMGVICSYLYSCERPRVVLALQWLGLAALVVAMSTVGRIGTAWTCGSVATVFVLHTLAALWAVRRIQGIPVSKFLLPLVRPLAVCVAMVATIVLLRPALHGLAPAIRLGAEVAIGAAVYLCGAVVVFRDASREIVALARSALSRR